jgi:hypothetical protein
MFTRRPRTTQLIPADLTAGCIALNASRRSAALRESTCRARSSWPHRDQRRRSPCDARDGSDFGNACPQNCEYQYASLRLSFGASSYHLTRDPRAQSPSTSATSSCGSGSTLEGGQTRIVFLGTVILDPSPIDQGLRQQSWATTRPTSSTSGRESSGAPTRSQYCDQNARTAAGACGVRHPLARRRVSHRKRCRIDLKKDFRIARRASSGR